jgi:Lipocalin-like domain
MTDLTLEAIRGRWELTAWETRVGETLIRPLGEHPQGVIYYTDDGWMAVQITGPGRPAIGSADPLGGTEQERAAAYATCLAYCGTYEIRDGHIVHNVQLSTFPNWAGEVQVRSAELHGDRLVLRSAPVETPAGTVDAELRWARRR